MPLATPNPEVRAGLLGLACSISLGASPTLCASDHFLEIGYDADHSALVVSVPPDPASYFLIEHSANLTTFADSGIALGRDGPSWVYAIPVESEAGFFRVRAISLFAVQDTDGDGLDDLYELEHPSCLDPLDPADAAEQCLQAGFNNLQIYLRDLFGGPAGVQFFSREATVFNFGAPTARFEALSPEISVYNATPGSGPPASDLNQVFSREATVWNFGSPAAHVEALSSEVSIYNASAGSGPPATDLNQVFSRETTVWNFGSPCFAHDALSREMTVFNFGQPTAKLEAISREVTVLNFEEPTLP